MSSVTTISKNTSMPTLPPQASRTTRTGPLFRTSGPKTGQPQPDEPEKAHAMIQRRAQAAHIKARIGNTRFASRASPPI
jgi:hypothetical protein